MTNPTHLIPLLLVSSLAIADSQVGSIDASDSTWDRPTATGSGIDGSCNAFVNDSLNDAVSYDVFYVRAANATTFLDVWANSLEPTPIDFDPMLVAYCGPFDPAQPNVNVLNIDDDSGLYPNPSLAGTVFIDPNEIFTIVVSSYSNHPASQFGSYELILGPGLFFSTACLPDFSGDGVLNFFDVSAFIALYSSASPAADLNHDGIHNFFDVSAFLAAFANGCP